MAAFKKIEEEQKLAEEQRRQRVFVVHGRNEELRKSMFDFLRSIGLKPIEWSQAIQMTGETAPFVGDILDTAFLHAQAVIVLLTGDDEARLRPEYHFEKMPDYEKNLTPQSRPNVLFEAGLAMGRFPKQTIIVEVGNLRPFSDIAGRHTIRLDNSTKTRQDVAQRLELAGCKIDLSGTDWHQTGIFDIRPFNTKKEINTNKKSENNEILSKLPKRTNPSVSEVSDNVLLAVANYPGNKIVDLAKYLEMPIEKAKFILGQLESSEYIRHVYETLSMREYYILDKGVQYLIDKDLF